MGFFGRVLRVAWVCCLASVSISQCAAGSQQAKNYRRAQIRAAVAAIVKKTIAEGSRTTSQGVQVWMPIPPSNEAVSEVRSLGPDAIPVLSTYLWTSNDRENLVAGQLLGRLGEASALGPFADVAKKHKSAAARIRALRFLSVAPPVLSGEIFEWSARNDPDPAVRSAAKDILASRRSDGQRK